MNKRTIYRLLFAVAAAVAFTASAFGQNSRTNQIFRPCSGSTTPASVKISVAGAISLTPCSGQTISQATPSIFTQGTITASTPFISHTATWNSGGTTFTNFYSNVTDTASGASSLLMDLRVGGTTQFSVSKGGNLTVTNYLLPTSGMIINGNLYVEATGDGVARFRDGSAVPFAFVDKTNGFVLGASADTGLARFSAGVFKTTNGSTAINGLIGGGAAIASATALPVPTGNVFHVTGTTNITSITSTNLASGVCVTLIFDGILTFTDGSNLKLAGNFVTTADDTISLCYDGTNWYETARAVN